MDKLKLLQKKLEKYNITYIPIDTKKSWIKIYNLFKDEIIFEPMNDVECIYLGEYYEHYKSYSIAFEYYAKAGNIYGNVDAMMKVAHGYSSISSSTAKHYYLMAFNSGHTEALRNIIEVYIKEQDYESAEKYLLMAIDCDCYLSSETLINFYTNIKKDMPALIKLCQDNPTYFNQGCISKIINYLWTEKLEENTYNDILDFLLSQESFIDKDAPSLLKIFIKLLKDKLDLMKLHFDYSEKGKGFQEAKQDFYDSITKI